MFGTSLPASPTRGWREDRARSRGMGACSGDEGASTEEYGPLRERGACATDLKGVESGRLSTAPCLTNARPAI